VWYSLGLSNNRPRGLFVSTVHPSMTPARHTIQAGAAYFAIVFAVGFALGTVRTLFLAPRLGEQLAVIIELPLILGASWLACGWVLRRWPVEPATGPRLTMGAAALALLILAEIALSLTAFDRSLADYFRNFTTLHGLIGLAGQIVFALMPLLRARIPHVSKSSRGP
jgi:predicted Abi (CAAX) family protease